MKKNNVVHMTKNLAANGITNVVLNYCINLDSEKYNFTIMCGSPVEEIYRKTCEENNIQLIELPNKIESSKAYYMAIWRHLSRKKCDIVHIHGNSATMTVELLIATMKGIKARVAHSHNSTCDNLKIHKLLSPIMKRLYTKGFACSNLAGKWLFGNSSYDILPNGFKVEKFLFDLELRNKIRNQLSIEDKFVIGCVARFNDQKNHPFLLDIFTEIAKRNEDAVLLLVGNGPKLDEILSLIQNHPYRDRIIYYGITDDIYELYCAMDVFLLPTKYEGLGIVFIEAQINGLPCVTSDQVPEEVDFGGRVKFLSLDEKKETWAMETINSIQIDRTKVLERYSKQINEYDIKSSVKILDDYYEGAIK